MNLTYANVMSTIAMVAAMTTGTSYAAAQLGANSVGTVQIKNNQVTLADLHPSVRKKLGARPVTGGGGSTTAQVDYRDTGVVGEGQQLFPCTGTDCSPTRDDGDRLIGYTSSIGLGGMIGSAGNVQFRLAGSLVNHGTLPVAVQIRVHGSGSHPVAASDGNIRRNCGTITIPAGQSFAVPENLCGGAAGFPASGNQFVRIRFTATPSGEAPSITSNMRLDVRKA